MSAESLGEQQPESSGITRDLGPQLEMALRKKSTLWVCLPEFKRLEKVLGWAPQRAPLLQTAEENLLVNPRNVLMVQLCKSRLVHSLLALPVVIKLEVKGLGWRKGRIMNLREHHRGEGCPEYQGSAEPPWEPNNSLERKDRTEKVGVDCRSMDVLRSRTGKNKPKQGVAAGKESPGSPTPHIP